MSCGVVERCYEPITHDDLARLAVIATGVLEDLFGRRPTTSGLYRDRLLLLALCQGGGQHFVDQRHGVKDLDVWAFFGAGPERPFPWRSRWVADLGLSHLGQHPDDEGFEGRRVDVLGRSIQAGVDEDGVDSVRRWLSGWSKSARHLAQRPVVVVAPIDRLGQIIWPVEIAG